MDTPWQSIQVKECAMSLHREESACGPEQGFPKQVTSTPPANCRVHGLADCAGNDPMLFYEHASHVILESKSENI